MKFSYCPTCGEKLILKEIGDEGLVPYCIHCQRPYFDLPTPCVFLVVVDEKNKVLTIKQSYGMTGYVLVAGYLKLNESIEEAALRELKEETGLDGFNCEYIKSYFQPGKENLMIGISVKVKSNDLNFSSEVREGHFVPIEEALKDLEGAVRAYDLVKTYKEVKGI